MNNKIFIEKLNKLKTIAHRLGYSMTNYPENSIEVLETIFSNKEMLDSCNGFEFDICFTKDNVPVVMHDKYIDDISDNTGLVKSYTLDELKNMDFGFRKSKVNKNEDYTFKIVTLDELLNFFSSNQDLLGNKIIKIETKEPFTFDKKQLLVLADILNKNNNLNSNIVHLSYWPQNLRTLKLIQKEKNYNIIKTDLLCDYSLIVGLSKYMKFIDYISLRIKPGNLTNNKKTESTFVNIKVYVDNFFMNLSDAAKEKTMKYAIDRFGSVGLYVFNNENQTNELSKIISDEFFEENYDKIFFTTDNPNNFKKR